MNSFRLNNLASPLPLDFAKQDFGRLQIDLMSRVRMWAVDDVGAAIAHQFNEPLTALRLYLHAIIEGEEYPLTETAANARREMVERALHETERLCDIMGLIGETIEDSPKTKAAVTQGPTAVDRWAKASITEERRDPLSALAPSCQNLLTAREREVLALISQGASNKQGGARMGISTRTFETHRARIMAKLGARNSADLIRITLTEIG